VSWLRFFENVAAGTENLAPHLQAAVEELSAHDRRPPAHARLRRRPGACAIAIME
jgi:hypothetical protein